MDEMKQAKNLFRNLIKDQNSNFYSVQRINKMLLKKSFYSVQRINKMLLKKSRTSVYDKDKVFYKIYNLLEDKETIYENTENGKTIISFYMLFDEQKKGYQQILSAL